MLGSGPASRYRPFWPLRTPRRHSENSPRRFEELMAEMLDAAIAILNAGADYINHDLRWDHESEIICVCP